MRSLLDVNVIIALLDPNHINNDRAHKWWKRFKSDGWASCPISENGFIRVSSRPNYSASIRYTPADCIMMLRVFAERHDHKFWPDNLSFKDKSIFSINQIHGPGQLTDIYLLALAVKNGGRLVTFDRRIPLSAVIGSTPENLCIIESTI